MENKPYFTIYLPVEGEIKEGDCILITSPNEEKIPVGTVLVVTGLNVSGPIVGDYTIYHGDFKKVKLFLCSRDIKIHDMTLDKSTFSPVLVTEEGYKSDLHEELIKVIGEISPDALGYVKEGMEFSEDEIEFWHNSPKEYGFVIDPKLKKDWQEWVTMVKIKGKCGHFH